MTALLRAIVTIVAGGGWHKVQLHCMAMNRPEPPPYRHRHRASATASNTAGTDTEADTDTDKGKTPQPTHLPDAVCCLDAHRRQHAIDRVHRATLADTSPPTDTTTSAVFGVVVVVVIVAAAESAIVEVVAAVVAVVVGEAEPPVQRLDGRRHARVGAVEDGGVTGARWRVVVGSRWAVESVRGGRREVARRSCRERDGG
jgi:hypothetical protein